ncbi:hypothetical protein N431DRAFT_450180 [Stipitochalara longipes BDJ]|nr:hypothetical protein N431DRAFT_450180 [Stipitochalara longipes BDJ]
MAVSLSLEDGSNELQDEGARPSRASNSPQANQSQLQPPPDMHFKLTITDPAQSFVNLNWIDENQRRDDHEGLKKKVRSHVRRGIHTKQRRLNAAARARPLHSGARRIVQKGKGTDAGNSISSEQEAISLPANTIISQPVGYSSSIAGAPKPLMTPYVLSNQDSAPTSSIMQLPGRPSLESIHFANISSQSSQQHNSAPLPRQQFNNTLF